jgi:UDP-glucose 4-epimerase
VPVKVLITGGAGFIGSTVASACLDAGLVPVVLDDLSAGRREFTAGRIAYEGDVADAALLDRVLDEHPDITAAVHCAARIVVPESVAQPAAYYENNVVGTLRLAQHLLRRGCTRLLFSSSASIYGAPGADFSVDECSPLDPASPYARSKAIAEQILADISAATALRVLSLRYFNPIGADPALRTGLQHRLPSHALGKLITAHESGTPFTLTGTDWPTRDGSAIRDFVHVWDLARAHVAALLRFDDALDGATHRPINLGTGRGTTVRELVDAFRAVVGDGLQVVEGPRRPGDVVGAFTRSHVAEKLLGWTAERSLTDGVADALAWSARRPQVLRD